MQWVVEHEPEPRPRPGHGGGAGPGTIIINDKDESPLGAVNMCNGRTPEVEVSMNWKTKKLKSTYEGEKNILFFQIYTPGLKKVKLDDFV